MELLIVVAIMGVFTALAFKLFEADASAQLQITADTVVADLDLVRSLAVSNGSTYRVTVDVTGNNYFIRHQGSNSAFNILPTTSFHAVSDSGKQLTANLADLPTLSIKATLTTATTGAADASNRPYVDFNSVGGTISTATSTICVSRRSVFSFTI